MKRSQLKEAIKAEITSVLSENVNPAFDKKIANFAKKINSEMDYQGGVLEAMKQIKSRLERIISKVEGAKRGGADEEPLMKMIGLKEEAGFTEVSQNEIKMHLDQYNAGKIDGDDLANAIEEIVFGRVSFADIREEEEMSDDDKDKAASKEAKKKDSIATISNKLQKLTAKMKKKAKEFKEAEGKAKDKLKDELKDMTAEKKKLEKDL
jgi:hypothetical protein